MFHGMFHLIFYQAHLLLFALSMPQGICPRLCRHCDATDPTC